MIDVEGNGQHPDPDLVEVAVVAITDGHVQPARSWLIRPPRPVSWQARKVHGLSTDDLADAPTIEEVADDIVDSLHGVEVLVGHHVTVDLTVLRRSIPTWPDLPVIDTLRLARAWHPKLPTHRLGALADRFHLTTDLPGPAHRAGYDATVTARLLLHLASSHPGATTQQLLDIGAPPSGQPTHPARTAPAQATDALFEVP